MQYHKAYASPSDCEVLVVIGNKQMSFKCSSKQYLNGMKKYREGAMMQNAFDFLSVDEREFLISGTTPEEWQRMFGDGE